MKKDKFLNNYKRIVLSQTATTIFSILIILTSLFSVSKENTTIEWIVLSLTMTGGVINIWGTYLLSLKKKSSLILLVSSYVFLSISDLLLGLYFGFLLYVTISILLIYKIINWEKEDSSSNPRNINKKSFAFITIATILLTIAFGSISYFVFDQEWYTFLDSATFFFTIASFWLLSRDYIECYWLFFFINICLTIPLYSFIGIWTVVTTTIIYVVIDIAGYSNWLDIKK